MSIPDLIAPIDADNWPPSRTVPGAEMVLDALINPVLLIDGENRVANVNNSAETFFHTGRKNLVGQRLCDLVPFSSPALGVVETARTSGSPVSEYRIDLSSPLTGKGKLVDAFATIVANHIGDNAGHVCLQILVRGVSDTIDRQLDHQTVVRKAHGLSSMLAHEIKNPLSGIKGAAQLLASSVPAEDRALTSLIVDEADRIAKLVNRMEAFADQRPGEHEILNIHSVLGHVKLLAGSGFGRQIAVAERYDPSLPPVFGDRDQLVQLFLNLFKNAAEAVEGRPEARITLTTAYRPGIRIQSIGPGRGTALPIAVTVADNGPGVAQELQPFLFDPFVTTKANGSGLGLAMAAKIVSEHGGIIELDHSADMTAFRILFPAADLGSVDIHDYGAGVADLTAGKGAAT